MFSRGHPCKSECIEPFKTVNTPPVQVGVTPHKSEGISPSHSNTLLCPVGVTPHNRRYQPFTMVNTPQCQSRCHPCTDQHSFWPLKDVSSLSFSPWSMLSHIPLVKSPSPSWPAYDPITPLYHPVTSPLCQYVSLTPCPHYSKIHRPQVTDAVVTPIRSECPQSAFVEEVTMRPPLCYHWALNQSFSQLVRTGFRPN